MRVKKPRFVITFASTTDAMAMESASKRLGLPGRLIPVPRDISASCGLSYMCEVEEAETLKAAIEQENLQTEGFYTILMY
ncbi:MAG: DUF3343 domain-containing protein [Lachnospiraceae bacterium]|nr:DUF3343 domain-containing protein [Lachnospiraceae bacterium]